MNPTLCKSYGSYCICHSSVSYGSFIFVNDDLCRMFGKTSMRPLQINVWSFVGAYINVAIYGHGHMCQYMTICMTMYVHICSYLVICTLIFGHILWRCMATYMTIYAHIYGHIQGSCRNRRIDSTTKRPADGVSLCFMELVSCSQCLTVRHAVPEKGC